MGVPVRDGQIPGVIMQTDQGSEHTDGSFRQTCERLGVHRSRGRPGSAPDDAVIEAWHSTRGAAPGGAPRHPDSCASQGPAWIEDYDLNRRRRFAKMTSPVDYERTLAESEEARHAHASPVLQPQPVLRSAAA